MVTPAATASPSPARRAATEALGRLPLYFVENRGQDDDISYYVKGRDKTIFFAPDSVAFVLAPPQASLAGGEPPDIGATAKPTWTVKLDFLGADPTVRPVGIDPSGANVSYFRGPPDQWKVGLRTYRGLRYAHLWPGVDLVYEGEHSTLKYTFHVSPGADPGKIRLAYRGAEALTVDDAGALAVTTPVGTLHDGAPIAWQDIGDERIAVPVHYALEAAEDAGWILSFNLGDYDPAHALVIDPAVLVYAGFIGGVGAEGGISGPQHGIAVDAAGSVYVVGTTSSSQATFPDTVGPDITYNNQDDVFVAKINSAGTALVYAGYIGGASDNQGYDIAVDGSGAAYVTGFTTGVFGFPQIVGPDLTFAGGGSDAFVAKVNPAGTALVYCGFIGGSGAELGYGIAVDTAGAAYVTGHTGSADLPAVTGPGLAYNGGTFDAFVAKVDPSGAGFNYLGYVGGSGSDVGSAITVDATGAAYVTGGTSSTEATFPVTAGSLDTTFNGGGSDAFVAKINAAGTGVTYAGYIGGSGTDSGNDIAVDGSNNAYVTGETDSTEATFPETVGSLDTTYGGLGDAFVAKINATGSALVYAGYIGGGSGDSGNAIAVNSADEAYVVGTTTSDETTFPVSEGPDLFYNTGGDAFVARINSAGSAYVYAGYIGGSAGDTGFGVAVDSVGDAFVVGRTCSSEATFPATAGSFDPTYNDGCDSFVAKVNFVAAPIPNIDVVPTAINFGAVAVGSSTTQTVTVTNNGSGTLTLGTIGTPAAPYSRVGGTCVNNQTLAPAASCTIDIQFAPTVAGGASANFNIPSDDPDAGTGNGQNNTQVTLSGSGLAATDADLALAMTAAPDPVNVGSNLTYTITATNNGPAGATGVTVTDALPVSVTFVSATPSQGSCSGTTTVTCSLGGLGNGASATITLIVTPTAPGALANTASVAGTSPDPNGVNDSASTTTTVNPLNADLALTITDAPDPVIVGNNLSYTVTVTNNGPAAATAVTVTDVLPGSVTFVSATPSQGSCSGTTTVTCSLGGIANGANATITLVVTPTAVGALANSVSVTTTSNDPNGANDSATANTTVSAAEADMAVSISAAPNPVSVNGTLTYTVTITNNGPLGATGVTATTTLSGSGFTFGGITPSQGSCTGTTSASCAIGALANGASATVAISVTPTAIGSVSLNASATAAEPDVNGANNAAAVAVNAVNTICSNATSFWARWFTSSASSCGATVGGSSGGGGALELAPLTLLLALVLGGRRYRRRGHH